MPEMAEDDCQSMLVRVSIGAGQYPTTRWAIRMKNTSMRTGSLGLSGGLGEVDVGPRQDALRTVVNSGIGRDSALDFTSRACGGRKDVA